MSVFGSSGKVNRVIGRGEVSKFWVNGRQNKLNKFHSPDGYGFGKKNFLGSIVIQLFA